jgi:hypothetical protein
MAEPKGSAFSFCGRPSPGLTISGELSHPFGSVDRMSRTSQPPPPTFPLAPAIRTVFHCSELGKHEFSTHNPQVRTGHPQPFPALRPPSDPHDGCVIVVLRYRTAALITAHNKPSNPQTTRNHASNEPTFLRVRKASMISPNTISSSPVMVTTADLNLVAATVKHCG